MSDESGIPDVFADSVNISFGPYGVTFTLLVTEPLGVEGKGGDEPRRMVGRVRMTPALVRDLLPILINGLEANRVADAENAASALAQGESMKAKGTAK